MAANNKGIQLVGDLIDEYSLEVVQAYMRHIQVRQYLRAIGLRNSLAVCLFHSPVESTIHTSVPKHYNKVVADCQARDAIQASRMQFESALPRLVLTQRSTTRSQVNAEEAVRQMLADFSVEVGLPETGSVVAEDQMDDGSPIVLKVCLPCTNRLVRPPLSNPSNPCMFGLQCPCFCPQFHR